MILTKSQATTVPGIATGQDERATSKYDMMLNRIRVAQDYLTRKTVCNGLPVELSIELTSKCNLKCVMCPRDDNSIRGLGNMQLATFARIIGEAGKHLEFAYLHLAGEPLLHPEFNRFIDYAADNGVRIGLSTNGTTLTTTRTNKILASKLDTLIVSIDGTDAETYRAIRGANSFARVIRNTENFLRLKQAAGHGPHTVIQMICMRENYHQAKEFCRRWKKMGVDAVRLKRFFNFAGNVDDHSIDDGGVVRDDVQRPPCYLPWRQLAFYYDGTAVACCHDFLHQAEVGNINQNSLADIWNSPALVALREKHVNGQHKDVSICANCNQPQVSSAEVVGSALFHAASAKRYLITAERIIHRFRRRSLY